MAKLLFILSALLLQACIEAATSPELSSADTKFNENDKIEEAGPTLNSNPRGLSGDTNNNGGTNSQGQRRKRFNNFNFGFAPYSPYNPTYVKRDNTQDTAVYGSEDPLSQIFKRVQDILIFTRQQAFSPPSTSHVPPYIPVFYIPQFGCGCTPDNNQGPKNDEQPNDGVSEPSHITTTMSPMLNPAPTKPPSTANEPVYPSPTDTSTPDFSSRFPQMDDYEDGARPISFDPVKPKRPLSRPPPPVDHGSSQAGSNGNNKQDAPVTTIPTTTVTSNNKVSPQPDLFTNKIPTLCDGAVLSCCHRAEVTYSCFVSQGCPNPIPSDKPCDANVIFDVVRKFQYYYANRKVSNNLS